MTESRQVRRANERAATKNQTTLATHKVVYKPFITKSRAGVNYTHYRKVIEEK